MCATKRRSSAGMVMILVLLLVALLLIVALAVITGTNTAAQSTTAVSVKYRVLNAAEGAANAALDDLSDDPAEINGTQGSGTLNGASWVYTILKNNLLGSSAVWYTDPKTGQNIKVPAGSAYVSGVASETVNGGHGTSIDAMIQPTTPLLLPSGAMNAVHDILDNAPMAINGDPTDLFNPNDADIHANNDIRGSASTMVQGRTFAVNIDELKGYDGLTNPGSSAVKFPTAIEIAQAVRTANLSALAGAQLSANQVVQTGTHTYTGNVFIEGNLAISNSTITFSQGTYVYVDGNLCITGTGQINDFNTSANTIVVAGNVEIANGGAYSTTAGENTLMLVLGSDNASNPCSTSNTHAVDFEMSASAANPIGTIFASAGSIDLMGTSSVSGALDAGFDILLDGTNSKRGMQYEVKQAQTALNTGTLVFQSYIEY